MNKHAILASLTPEIVDKFRRAIELGKWDNGDKLTKDQLQTCMQAVLVWEYEHLPVDERTGYLPKKSDCNSEHDRHYPNTDEQAVTLKH